MYKVKRPRTETIVRNTCTVGETLIKKLQRVMLNKEPITDGAQPIYTDRKDGVLAETDIRTDKFDEALGAMDRVAQKFRERRAENIVKKIEKDNPPKGGKAGENSSGESDKSA